MVFDDLQKQYPLLTTTAAYLEGRCYFFKGVLKQIREINPALDFGEELCNKALELCNRDWNVYLKRVDALIEFSLEFLRLQIELEKTGRYKYATFKEVEEKVYNDSSRVLVGPWYTWALFYSQFFWVTHQRVFKFFIDEFVSSSPASGSVLEVPSGTGLYLTYFLKNKPSWQGVGVDISESAKVFTEDVLRVYDIGSDRCLFVLEDLHTYEPRQKFDRIMCGEFLEHVEDPFAVLSRLHGFLKNDGKFFVTVAVWAAMIDHIYLYRSAEEVRKDLQRAGFEIEKELVQAVFKGKSPESEKTPVNYCAILRKRN
ncbi:MAG: hypothetical protein A3H69_02020 [Candidatus Sungbacteria bacterium RIFCSPLOWO2_02_FULL_47_9]|uniref:Methyltransferase type 12 domain-containing protein n=1 Tax=Candidatus Sungbacteria bacterium RIFCSPHIGHO2_01_FULL_47_32 TaxID=1802264 RepID=A0A1G2K9H6_9BACT|nr:MAG: HAD-superfamily phosphatase subfamily IIIC:FkbH-like protein domain protein [Parcubacteria group bacterium GW2011_GWA2_47_10]OGZ95130.1 MAG: hypothetical protein A2633_06375 [Candidatus Sungbacteria bacterium RIFCSPHIGHO2_01_FULL_47_32]OGZ98203.1 MAG: hypothetical protein A3D57_03240 [Candidatus Sungbacteria bacterium RIFCSPHIGHO2_02_FULL_46_12]OHA05610.1 MAG: hypothetical protein A3A28_00370 [Candidatus Sungbacteria bacterium RIFCSPLOWO2_01_FULL_47_32]OHA12280.1 MAG: hypothetical prote